MAESTANAIQTVNPGETVIFTLNNYAGGCPGIFHRNETGEFLIQGGPNNGGCCCCNNNTREVLTSFGANIAIPTGGTVEEISLAIAVDGTTLPYTTMRVTPATVEEYWNVSRTTNVPIWRNCCQSVSIRNTSTQPILVQNANIVFQGGVN